MVDARFNLDQLGQGAFGLILTLKIRTATREIYKAFESGRRADGLGWALGHCAYSCRADPFDGGGDVLDRNIVSVEERAGPEHTFRVGRPDQLHQRAAVRPGAVDNGWVRRLLGARPRPLRPHMRPGFATPGQDEVPARRSPSPVQRSAIRRHGRAILLGALTSRRLRLQRDLYPRRWPNGYR
jgi:hypothetical protein